MYRVYLSVMNGQKFSMKQLFRASLAGLAFSGLAALPLSAGAASKLLYVNAPTGSVTAGASVTVEVRVDSGTEPVNAVQANLEYDPTKLKYVSVDPTGSAFPLAASIQPTSGLIKIARATAGGAAPSTGDVLFANVKFKALAPGIVGVTVASGSHVVRSTDSLDLLPNSNAASPTPGVAATATPLSSTTDTGGFLGLNDRALLAGIGVAAGVLVVFAIIMKLIAPRVAVSSGDVNPAVKPSVVLPNDAAKSDNTVSSKR